MPEITGKHSIFEYAGTNKTLTDERRVAFRAAYRTLLERAKTVKYDDPENTCSMVVFRDPADGALADSISAQYFMRATIRFDIELPPPNTLDLLMNANWLPTPHIEMEGKIVFASEQHRALALVSQQNEGQIEYGAVIDGNLLEFIVNDNTIFSPAEVVDLVS